MAFSIRLLPEPVPDLEPTEKACWGVITIGAFQERFIASLDYWAAKDYLQHWKQAVNRIVHGSTPSCLVTSMHDPATANFIVWWPMYRVGSVVCIQNQVLFLDSLSSPFNQDDPFSQVSERVVVNEDGEKISEWVISVKDLEAFLKEEAQARTSISTSPYSHSRVEENPEGHQR